MSRTLLDLVSELNTLNDDNLAERVIKDSDVQWCLSELQDILEVEQPTLTPQNEPLTPCDVCMYNPPSSMGGKPCCICPASPPVRDCEIMEYVETCEECGFCDGTSPERQEDT